MQFSYFSSKISKSYLLEKREMIKNAINEGLEIIDLSIAEPNIIPPYQLIEAFEQYLRDHKYNKYPPALGITELRENVAIWATQDCQFNISYKNIAITIGARGALFSIMQAILNPGDEVLLFAPYWSGYPSQIKLLGAIPKIISLDEDEDFLPYIEQLDKAYNTKTRLLIINNPHNPTGLIWNEELLTKLLNWANSKNIFVIADEVCSVEIFDDNRFTSMGKIKKSFNNFAIIRSFSKNLAIPGWRIGWAIGSEDLINKIDSIQGAVNGGCHSITQYALVDSWVHLEPWLNKTISIHQERRDALYKALSNMHGIQTIKPQGGITAFTNIRYYLGHEVGGLVPQTSSEFTKIIFQKTGVVLSSGENLGMEGFVRFCFTQDSNDITIAIQKIIRILEK